MANSLTTEQRQLLLGLLTQEMLCVISTIDDSSSKPGSALVAFTATPELQLIFGTSTHSRKYKNVLSNPQVSIVIGTNHDEKVSVQYEGVAEELTDANIETYRTLHLAKHPTSTKYAFLPEERFFIVTPTWLRYSNYLQEPHQIFEVTF